MKNKDVLLVIKLASIALKTNKYRVYKKLVKRINLILKSNGKEEVQINNRKRLVHNSLILR